MRENFFNIQCHHSKWYLSVPSRRRYLLLEGATCCGANKLALTLVTGSVSEEVERPGTNWEVAVSSSAANYYCPCRHQRRLR